MKEFLINLLILLSTPFYLIGLLVLAIMSLMLNVTDILLDFIKKHIEFMKSDYIEIYKILKGKLKNGNRKRKNKKEINR